MRNHEPLLYVLYAISTVPFGRLDEFSPTALTRPTQLHTPRQRTKNTDQTQTPDDPSPPATPTMAKPAHDKEAAAEFTSHYLQRATQELSEDIDAVRTADDFKADSVPFLVHALQQGAADFSPRDQERVVADLKGSSAAPS